MQHDAFFGLGIPIEAGFADARDDLFGRQARELCCRELFVGVVGDHVVDLATATRADDRAALQIVVGVLFGRRHQKPQHVDAMGRTAEPQIGFDVIEAAFGQLSFAAVGTLRDHEVDPEAPHRALFGELVADFETGFVQC
jgi:hypothetical protein